MRLHATKRNEIRYVYRGPVERGTGRGYRWHDGYSAASPTGNVQYPWMTKREAQNDAKSQGARAVFVREQEPSTKRHHATKKSPAQLDREIAEVLGHWEEDPFGGYRFITMNEDIRFDTAGVDPTYYRDPKWRQRWEFDLKREIEKLKAGKPTKLYKMSETHYRLPGTL